jgi:hypothetical protein
VSILRRIAIPPQAGHGAKYGNPGTGFRDP